jgi:hypothetical protein
MNLPEEFDYCVGCGREHTYMGGSCDTCGGTRFAKTPPVQNKTLVEGSSGTWFYHFSDDGKTARCGAKAMSTEVPESSWGVVTHLKERYCRVCAEKRGVSK